MNDVDVLIRSHGNSKFLFSAIDSVRKQEFLGRIKIHVSVFQATSEVMDRVEGMSRRDEICLHKCSRMGYAYPLNLMLGCAKGLYIAILDHDDLMREDRLQLQFDFLESHPDISAIGSSVQLIDELGNATSYKQYETNPENIRLAIFHKNPMAHPATMIRRSALIRVGGYRDFYDTAEDYDLWLRLSEFSSLSNLAEPLTYYRIHNSQVTHTNRFRNLTAGLAAVESTKMRTRGQLEIHERYKSPQEYEENLLVKIRISFRIVCEKILLKVRISASNKNIFATGAYFALLLLMNPKQAIWVVKLGYRKLSN